MTEWVINGSSSRRIPCNPKIGKRQQARRRRQKARERLPPPPPLPHCHRHRHRRHRRYRQDCTGEMASWRAAFTYLSRLGFPTEPGLPAPSSTTWSLPHPSFSLHFFLLSFPKKLPSLWLSTALLPTPPKSPDLPFEEMIDIRGPTHRVFKRSRQRSRLPSGPGGGSFL